MNVEKRDSQQLIWLPPQANFKTWNKPTTQGGIKTQKERQVTKERDRYPTVITLQERAKSGRPTKALKIISKAGKNNMYP